MILNSNLENKKDITTGDILFFSDCCAYLIVEDINKYKAIQILNNGNEELGYINYEANSILKLVEILIGEMENYPVKIVHISNIKISIE